MVNGHAWFAYTSCVCVRVTRLAMDFARCVLYCNECGDYVYDAELMDSIVRQEILESEPSKQKT